MPQVYICTRCAEKIDGATQDWVIVSMDTSGSAGLETRAHADCEAKRLKQIQYVIHSAFISLVNDRLWAKMAVTEKTLLS